MRLTILRTLFAIALILTFGTPAKAADPDNPKTPGNAAVRAETDDATKRREYWRQYYETPLSPQFMKYMNGAAARERARNGKLLPKVVQGCTASNPTIGITSLVTGSDWTNLGP